MNFKKPASIGIVLMIMLISIISIATATCTTEDTELSSVVSDLLQETQIKIFGTLISNTDYTELNTAGIDTSQKTYASKYLTSGYTDTDYSDQYQITPTGLTEDRDISFLGQVTISSDAYMQYRDYLDEVQTMTDECYATGNYSDRQLISNQYGYLTSGQYRSALSISGEFSRETNLTGIKGEGAAHGVFSNYLGVTADQARVTDEDEIKNFYRNSDDRKFLSGFFTYSDHSSLWAATPTPTTVPTIEPTIIPTIEPNVTPTIEPNVTPTIEPNVTPTIEPNVTPTEEPTPTPTATPNITPNITPTLTPTATPTVICPRCVFDYKMWLKSQGQ